MRFVIILLYQLFSSSDTTHTCLVRKPEVSGYQNLARQNRIILYYDIMLIWVRDK